MIIVTLNRARLLVPDGPVYVFQDLKIVWDSGKHKLSSEQLLCWEFKWFLKMFHLIS